jgi:ABC-type multidrug transport system fused ATPase/permease subunit
MSWREWRRLLTTYLRPHRWLVVQLGVALFGSIALQVATPQVVRTFVDRATARLAHPLGWLAVLYLLAVVLQQMMRVLTAWLSEVVGWLATNELRADLMAHCLSLDPSFHRGHPPGALIERIDGDVNGLSLFFAEFLLNVVGNLLLLTGVLAVVWFQSALAGALLTCFALVGLAVLVAVRRVSASAWGQSRQASAELYGFLEERLAGTEDIRSSAAEAFTMRGFYRRARDRQWSTSRARVMDAIPASVNTAIACAGNAVAFVLPALLVGRGELSVGAAFALYFYTQVLLQPLTNVSRQVEQLQQAIAGGRRILQLLSTSSEIVDGERSDLRAGPLGVALAHVTFGYGEDPDVLHDISLRVEAGEVLGVVGRTGSGKSSLAKLLVRLHDPRSGTVSVGGVDVRVVTRSQLRQRVALVTQDVHVLRASVRDNLTLFDASISDDAIIGAIDGLGLGAWFGGLPHGLDTVVREGGAGMSAGEAQLVSLGRAFLADPSVVILDEASSRLDPVTERILERAVDTLLEGRTGLVIAHRLSTITRCNKVCVVDHGRIVEYGDRAALAADDSTLFGLLVRTGLDVVAG